MRRALSVGLAVVLGIGVTFAVVRSARGGGHRANAVTTTLIRGVSGSEKQAFFQDPEVTADFAKHGYRLQVDYAGSREIATLPNLAQYDFAFPAGAPAAEKISREHRTVGQTQPFYTPMTIATFKPIAELLVRPAATSMRTLVAQRIIQAAGQRHACRRTGTK